MIITIIIISVFFFVPLFAQTLSEQAGKRRALRDCLESQTGPGRLDGDEDVPVLFRETPRRFVNNYSPQD